jgi:hypothetical protein
MENNELTPNEIRGVDLVVKALTKKYKFILGWEPDKKYREYDNTLFIHLKINYDMVSDYFGIRIKNSNKSKHRKFRTPEDVDPKRGNRSKIQICTSISDQLY